ncbi:hypothetical protein ARMGADRAFT_1033997 [Armillaria gallica]|uniref:Uncharacterized protein n=1 Tax=Armillaria gallica TaxID=47427 RepID=A0A2H3DA61_ARMGA|nr:hypothetical protein ARMGADRAFT_1033997 [Armillaria gallica]
MLTYLGQWLWKCLKKDSEVYNWFSMLLTEDQEEIWQSHVNFLTALKDDFLGNQWQQLINKVFKSQQFHQRDYKNETPCAFIMQKAMYTCMLTQANDGGVLEVTIVMRKALILWRPIINLSMVMTIKQLLSQVIEHQKTLIQGFKMERLSLSTINTGDLVMALKGLRILVSKLKFISRSAHLAAEETKALNPIINSEELISQELKEVPGEAEGEKHWDKECPHFEAYKLKMRKQAKLVKGVDGEEAYHLVYKVAQQDFKRTAIEVVQDNDEEFWKKRGYTVNYILEEVEKGELDRYVAALVASLAHKIYMAPPEFTDLPGKLPRGENEAEEIRKEEKFLSSSFRNPQIMDCGPWEVNHRNFSTLNERVNRASGEPGGLKMNLYQLTQEDTKLWGYIQTSVFT